MSENIISDFNMVLVTAVGVMAVGLCLCNGSWNDDGRASDSRAGDSRCDGSRPCDNCHIDTSADGSWAGLMTGKDHLGCQQ